VPVWTMFAVVIIILVAVGTFLSVWLGSLHPADSARSLPFAATPSLATPAGSMIQLTSKPTPTATLFVVSTPASAILTPTATREVRSPETTDRVIRYRVLPGDTLSGIAAKYHTSIGAIQQANRLQRETIYEGEALIIPVPTPIP